MTIRACFAMIGLSASLAAGGCSGGGDRRSEGRSGGDGSGEGGTTTGGKGGTTTGGKGGAGKSGSGGSGTGGTSTGGSNTGRTSTGGSNTGGTSTGGTSTGGTSTGGTSTGGTSTGGSSTGGTSTGGTRTGGTSTGGTRTGGTSTGGTRTGGANTGGTGGMAGAVTNGDPGKYHFEDTTHSWKVVRGPETAVVRASMERVFEAGKGLYSLEYVVPAVTQAEIDADEPDAQGVREVARGVGLNVPDIEYQTGTTKPIFAGTTMKVRVWLPAGYNAVYTTVFVLAPDPIVPGWWANANFLAVTPNAWNEFTFPIPAGMDIGTMWYTFGVFANFNSPWAGGSIFVDSIEF